MNPHTRSTAIPIAMIAAVSAVAADNADPTANFVAGSVWKGTWSGDARKADAKSVSATLRVKTRDGEKVAVTLKFAGKNARQYKAEGTVAADGTLRLKPTAVEGGKGAANPLDRNWIGRVSGDKVQFKVTGSDRDDNAVGPTAEFTLSDGKGGKGD